MHHVALRQIAEALGAFAQRQRRKRIATDMDRALRRQQPGERAQQCGLAGAVRPDQSDEVLARQRQRDVVQYLASGERDAEFVRGEEGVRHPTPPPNARRSRMIR